MPKILLIEDDGEYRRLLRHLIDQTGNWNCAAAFESAEEALRVARALKPDVVLSDLELPGMSGFECLRRLRELLPGCPLLVLTKFDDPKFIFPAMQAGAVGYVLKHDLGRIMEAIQLAYDGGAYATPSIARLIFEALYEPNPPRPLTPAERRILERIKEGAEPPEVAQALGISLRTIQKHLQNIYSKLHVHNLEDARKKADAPSVDPLAKPKGRTNRTV